MKSLAHGRLRNKIPDDIINNNQLNSEIERLLPNNYNFEIHKTISRIRDLKAKRVALQLPEGLQLFACVISDILSKFSYENSEFLDVVTMGDVTYGACCIDDYTSRALNCDLLVHYGHSCLVPLDNMKTLYVFVDIKFDTKHFIDTVLANFENDSHMVLVATVQFNNTLQAVRAELEKTFKVTIPKISPLTPGEILGCTAPTVSEADFILYLGDGRFHLESIMMANPILPAYRYDPYSKEITKEQYDHILMQKNRFKSIEKAKSAKTFGIILSTLGRQGSSTVLNSIVDCIEKQGLSHVTILLSEIFPTKLDLFGDMIDAFIQIACPRLSIDWGTFFEKPLLTPYEAMVALGITKWMPNGNYPMDFYAYDSLGSWTPNHGRRHVPIGYAKTPKQLIQIPVELKDNKCSQHGWAKCTNAGCVYN